MSESSVLDFQMEHNANSLHEAIKYMPEVQLILSNGKPLGCNGKIDAISGTVQSNTGSVNLRAKFPNPKQLLRNGSTAQIIIPHNFDSCIVVPKTATLELQTKIFVYKVVDHEAILTPVEISKLSSPTEYFVTEGLKPGDVIIAKGAGLVKNGAKID
jgi:membrane fusion protein (multidrug efflux system)